MMPLYPGAAMIGVLWLACGVPDDDTTVDTDDASTETDTETDDTDGEDTDSASWDEAVATVSGTVTWHVDFDADAEAAGYVDCDYTRTYAGIEDRSAPWICPGCDVFFRADVEMTEGRNTCYGKFVQGDPAPTEVIGWGGGTYFRTPYGNVPLSQQGTSAIDGDTVTVANASDYPFTDATGDHNAKFSIEGTLSRGTGTADPYWGMHAPSEYACGWTRSDRPEYTGDYTLKIGETVPDGVFPDGCGDPVRLHDLLGPWLIIDVSAKDCGPCQSMADSEHDFAEQMASEGVEVRNVTLLQVSLSDPYTTADEGDIYDWQFAFDLTDPILSDRGWGIGVLGVGAEAITGEDFGYPTWAVVDPDGKVVSVNVGFGGWDAVADIIRANR
jgi:thiol-disulfide isomerase/thioredoxin